jgi:hypothetical protein
VPAVPAFAFEQWSARFVMVLLVPFWTFLRCFGEIIITGKSADPKAQLGRQNGLYPLFVRGLFSCG